MTIVSAVLANTLAFLAIAYFFVDQTDLPDFFPHASSASDAATDIPMGFVLLGLAGLAAYAAVQSHLHRSWMRTRRWHRKHGRW